MNRIHTFNTGRLYSAKGQRIAWTRLTTDNVAMVDVDRGIEYVLIVREFSTQGIMSAYDRCEQAPWDKAEQAEAYRVMRGLTEAAKAL